jgi:transcriptional regulator with XRE-family HTH domain
MNVIGKRLREARERKDLKQTEVNKKTGINNKTLSGYENGVSEPDSETLKTLSELYEVSIDWLMGIDNPFPNDKRKSDVWDEYLRLPQSKKKLIDDMIKALKDEG